MVIYDLPTKITIGGKELPIRSDYRVVLDILCALSDPELSGEEKTVVALYAFLPDFMELPVEDYQEAVEGLLWFINGGQKEQPCHGVKLMDWEQDFPYIVAPINRVVGLDVRSLKYMHWWTFLSHYYEIGDCLFAQIVRIRDMRARGKTLDKVDREWLRKNAYLVNFETKYTHEENELVDAWVKGGDGNAG